jgi:hypothetical protein
VRKVGLGFAAAVAVALGGSLLFNGSSDDAIVPEADATSLPVEQVTARVERLRGLKFKQRPKVEVVTTKQLEDELKGVERESARELKGNAKKRADGLAMAAELVSTMTGLVDYERDKDVLQREGEVGVAGMYVPERGRIYVVEEVVEQDADEGEAVLAHELTHALEDQTFHGFERDPKPFADSAFARHALHEGSATLTEVLYRIEHQRARGPVDRVLAGIRKQTSDTKAPPGMNVFSSFPYADGGKFAAALHRDGGWSTVNRAHRHPPKTTAAVLHPGAWPEDRHERPRFTVADELSPEWTRLGRADVGEVDTLAILRAGLPDAAARAAAHGWEAGRFEAYLRKGIDNSCKPPCRKDTAAVIVWRMADAEQAERLNGALAQSLQKAAKGRPQDGGVIAFDGGAAAQAQRGRVAVLAFAPTADEAKKLAAAAPRPR